MTWKNLDGSAGVIGAAPDGVGEGSLLFHSVRPPPVEENSLQMRLSFYFQIVEDCKLSLDCAKLTGEKRKAEDCDVNKDLKKTSQFPFAPPLPIFCFLLKERKRADGGLASATALPEIWLKECRRVADCESGWYPSYQKTTLSETYV
ncbi:hypothetical protein RUM43_009383 [Polyplax serrata]|uniref:Uncharacterized protein n=1 Tax=Polyplax serrata TaxID=468196 RepID=A0AAN8NQD5_POLSC